VAYGVLADLVLVVHLAFIVFVVAGGVAVARWPRVAWLHLPAAIWGALIELADWICPLTPLENWLRRRAGMGGYQESFVEHYLLPIVYPAGLTRRIQLALGFAVIVLNVTAYAWVRRRSSVRSSPPAPPGSNR
jgi:hypothetical protein